MPANSRWDLIRRLRVNFNRRCLLHFLSSFSTSKRDSKMLQFARLANSYQRVFVCLPSLPFHAINNGYWQLGSQSMAVSNDSHGGLRNCQSQRVIPARSQIRFH